MNCKSLMDAVYDHEPSAILTTRKALGERDFPGPSPTIPAQAPEVQETVKGKHIMFNLKRTLTAAALSTALAGGIVGLGTVATTTSANASAVSVGVQAQPKCAWLTGGGKVRKGHIKNKLTANFTRGFGWNINRERGCVKHRHINW